jgi:2-oxoglutarate dehydrogenase E1 component
VVVPSTPAQYFHLLRRQALRATRKPLVVMTPKSLLRLPAARSTAEELTGGHFADVLPDLPDGPDPRATRRVVLCSGKVFYDLARRRKDAGRDDVALVRLEQLYPFPAEELRVQLDAYEDAEVRWVQEEPENMGAWRYVHLRAKRELGLALEVVSREEGAAPATGSPTIHAQEQRELVERALNGA